MKKRISMLSLVVFVVTLISPLSAVNATEIINDKNVITIEENQNINSDEELIIDDNHTVAEEKEEVKDFDNEEYSEEINSNVEEHISSASENSVQPNGISEFNSKYDKKYVENMPVPQLYSNFEEKSDKIDEGLSEEDIIDGYEVLETKTDDNYEIALAYSDGSYYFIDSTNNYTEAINILEGTALPNSEEIIIPVIINKSGQVIYTTSGIAYILNTGNLNINIYTTSTLQQAYTYANQGYVNDVPLIESTSTAAKIQVNGYIGWVSIDDIQIVPINQVSNPSYYTVSNGVLKHYISKDITGNSGNIINTGVAPSYLKENTKYFSYDGIYFYDGSDVKDSLNLLVSDLKNNHKNNSVNSSNPYYSYYQYLPFRSKTIYTAQQLDEYINDNTVSSSKLRGIGQALKDAEEKYGVNALLILGVAINESAWGTSNICQTKNNLFGIKAYDSDVNQASTFETPGDSVLEFAKNYISTGYANPNNWRYYGGFLGNKNLGANVKYASDPFWGEKAAKYALDVDLYYANSNVKNLKDYNRYKIGIYTSTNNVKNSLGTVLYNIGSSQRNLGASFIITNDNIINISGEARYEIYPDITSTSFNGEYNWNNKGYVKTSGVNIVSDGSNGSSNDSSDSLPLPEEPTGITGVIYSTNVKGYGWQDWVSNGELSGTEGQSKAIEGIRIKLSNYPNATIKYSSHVQDYGWQEWVSNGELSGTEGQSKRLEAIKIEATNLPENAELQYRVHVQNKGWQDWVSSGEIAGTVGQGLRLEAIEIRIIDPTSITYTTHIQDYGWQDWVSNGELSGTEGKSKRLEAIKIKFDNYSNANVKYSTHIQDIGWQTWKSNGELSGTEGKSKRIEAIKIDVTGLPEGFEVKYRVHVENSGWQDWVSNGEVAGTVGKGLRLEAIEIKVVKTPTISYKTHIQDIGWQSLRKDGEIAGTVGESKRLEAIVIEAENLPEGAYIKYMSHVQDLGWEKSWTMEGNISGSVGKLKRLEAIKIQLVGAPGYHIEYRSHIQDSGWESTWKRDGEISGSIGKSKRIEGIQIRIVQD